MKKILFLTVTMFFIFFNDGFSQLRIGAGLNWASKGGIETESVFGIEGRAEYSISNSIEVGFKYVYGFRESVDFLGPDATFGTGNLNFDLHWAFVKGTRFRSYALAGYNSITGTFKDDTMSVSESVSGLNLGLGARYNSSEKLAFFLEPKFVIGLEEDIDPRIAVSLGVMYRFNKKQSTEE